MRSGAELDAAWVLHRRSWRDTSLLVELLTAGYGRVGAVARGARAPRSRWRGVLEPFQAVFVDWRGRGELVTLSVAEPAPGSASLRGTRLAAGFYLSELCLRLLARMDPVPEIHAAYGAALQALSSATEPEDAALRRFERDLLAALGYGLLLETTADGDTLVKRDRQYRYELELGPRPDEGQGGVSISGAALLALARDEPATPAERAEQQRLTGAALRLYLGPRPLQSRALYSSLRRCGHDLQEDPA